MAIPRRTNRAHYKPYWFGDSGYGIAKAARDARKRGRQAYIDMNLNLTKDNVPVFLHWPNARKNGYKYIAVHNIGEKNEVRERLRLPKHRKVSDYHWSFVKDWRRTRRYGRSAASKVRPLSYYEAALFAKKKGVVITGELKTSLWGTRKGLEAMLDMKDFDTRYKITTYLMTLQSLRRAKEKLENARDAGYEFALLPRSREPQWWRELQSQGGRIWGRWRRR